MRFRSLPRVAMTKTSIALLSETIKTGNQAKLRELTQKAALNLTIASVLIFLLIWCNLDALFQLMPKGDYYSQAKPLMLIFMLGRILENSLGLARTLMLSRFFRHQLVLTFLMGAINIALSLWLVQTMGILGVAIGTGVALLLFSVGKFVLLYRGLGANPYTWPLLWILLVGGGVYALQGLLSLPDGGLVLTLAAMALRSLLIAGSFVGLVYWAGWSPQFNQVIDALIHRARRVLGR
jgi:O-antigen/teichoic acid export membrane protein